MAISKTGGIQLSAEINKELAQGNNLGAYRGKFFLHTPSNTARIIPLDAPISFSQLEGCTVLDENQPIAPLIVLKHQHPLTSNNAVSSTGTRGLSVTWESQFNPEPQPVLTFNVSQNNPVPITKWYETTGGAFTDVTNSLNATNTVTDLSTVKGSGETGYKVVSSIKVPLDNTGTRTFVAVGIAYSTRTDEGTICATVQEQFPQYTVNRTLGAAPGGNVKTFTRLSNPSPLSRKIITYSNGDDTFYPFCDVQFYFKIWDYNWVQYEPDLTTHDFPYSQNGYVATGPAFWDYTVFRSIDGGTFDDITSHFKFEGPIFEPSFTAIQKYEWWSKLKKRYIYTNNGVYRYRAVVYRKRTYTNPVGQTVTLSHHVAPPRGMSDFIQEVRITTKAVDNAIPTLLSVTIDRDLIEEEPGDGTFNVTVATQHAQGYGFVMTSSQGHVIPGNWNPRLIIERDEQTYTLGGGGSSRILASNQGQERQLDIGAIPYEQGEWASDEEIFDSVRIKNMGAMESLSSTGVDKGTVNEGESFTFTIAGINFPSAMYNDWTWDTTFPADTVVATSGSVNVPYSGDRFTGNYSGSFTVDTVERTNHYEDVTGGRIRTYYKGKLFAQTANNLKIKNTTAEPVTLPTTTKNPIIHHVMSKGGRRGEAVWETIYCIVTLRKNGTYTVNNEIYETISKDYALPQPLEGGWVPRVVSAGKVTQSTSQEDYLYNVSPSGSITATAGFNGGTATLTMRAKGLKSSMGFASVDFTWEFYNPASGATRTGGTISTSISLDTIPTGVDIWVEPEGGIYGTGSDHEPTPVIIFIEDGEETNDPVVVHPSAGTLIDTYCVGTSKFGKYARGDGGTYNSFIEANSTDCGYTPPKKAQDTAPTNPTVEAYNYADIQESVNATIAQLGVIDLSDILGSINISVGM